MRPGSRRLGPVARRQDEEPTMKRLSKDHQKQIGELASKLRSIGDNLTAEIEKFNDQLQEMRESIESDLTDYNEAIDEANQFRDDIHSNMSDYFDERSDKWKEGEAGGSYESWMDQWSNEFENAEVTFPDKIELPELSTADQIDDLPPEP
jgi:uncharacterized protein YukE